MSSGADATKAIARMVLLDGRFGELPAAVAEGRRVMANIERISRLFLTKTLYASVLAFVCGVFLLSFPFLPRQLSVVDGLTIGVLVFAHARIATAAGIDEQALRTGSTLILAIVALWVLIVVSRPFDLRKFAVLAAMACGLAVVFTLPMLRRFVALPPVEWAVVVAFSIAGVVLVETVAAATITRERELNCPMIADRDRPAEERQPKSRTRRRGSFSGRARRG